MRREKACILVQEPFAMAAENIIARFESKADAVVRKQRAILWALVIAFALLAAQKIIPVP